VRAALTGLAGTPHHGSRSPLSGGAAAPGVVPTELGRANTGSGGPSRSPADLAGHSPDGVRTPVGATHRKLSTFLNALRDAGLEAERFVEPPAPVPTYLLWRCRRR
jgi:hypothetical protein